MNYIIYFIIIFWSAVIGDEIITYGYGNSAKLQEKKSKKSDVIKVYKNKLYKSNVAVNFAKKNFLNSFKRQAKFELLDCLKKWKKPPFTLALVGTLHKNGFFNKISPLDNKNHLKPCIKTIIFAMNFESLTQDFSVDTLVVNWSIEW